MDIKAVSLCAGYTLKKDWFHTCAKSWNHIEGIGPVAIMDDGSTHFGDDRQETIESLGHEVISTNVIDEKVEPIISEYSGLTELRDQAIFFRKLVDINLLYQDYDRVLYIDTDVLVRNTVKLPSDPPDILYCTDEVSGYAGSFGLPLNHSMTIGLNAGFMLFTPGLFDLDFLDSLAKDYLIQSNNKWLTEQTSWSALASQTSNKGAFKGTDACVISGYNKRTPSEVKTNQTKWIASNRRINEYNQILQLIDNASVVHFAASAKDWIIPTSNHHVDYSTTRTLEWVPTTNATLAERALLSARIGLREVVSKWRS